MKINIGFVLALALLIALTACQGDGGSTSTTKMFAGGTQGLDLGFLEGSPPAEVFDLEQYPFDVEVKVENVGEWDVTANEVTIMLSGIDPTEFGKTEADFTKHPTEDLEGVELDSQGNALPGSVTFVSFEGLNKRGAVAGRVPFPIRADACYSYGTHANAKLCIKKDMLDNDDSICSSNELKSVENGGAPVHVVSLQQEPMGKDKISFTFKIQQRGLGALSRPGSDCSDDIGFEDEIKILVDTGDSGLECTGLKEMTTGAGPSGTGIQGFAKLNNGYRFITCKQPTSTNIDFEKLAHVTLTYDYKDHVDTTLTVKHSG